MGSAWAFGNGAGHPAVAVATFISALALQVAANLANDYWDHKKGADGDDRLGPVRVTSAGLLPPEAVWRGTLIALGVGCLAGLVLVVRAGWPLLALGLLCALLAVLYTAGPFPLAYRGLGDIFAFIFFGPVAVAGTAYAQTLGFSWQAILSGCVPGFYAVALMATNNLRDVASDRRVGKLTLAVRFGEKFARAEIAASVFAPAVVIAGMIFWGFLHPPTGWVAAVVALAMGSGISRVVFHGPGGATLNALFPRIGAAALSQAVLLSLGMLR